jgi:hypothetical protein
VLLTDRLGTVPPRKTPVIATPDSAASPELD